MSDWDSDIAFGIGLLVMVLAFFGLMAFWAWSEAQTAQACIAAGMTWDNGDCVPAVPR